MRALSRLLVAALALTLVVPVTQQAAQASPIPGATVHPRLLFSAADVPALRARVNGGGVPNQAWTRLRDRAEYYVRTLSPDALRMGVLKYDGQNQLNSYFIELGLAYQLSGDMRYARTAIDMLLATADAGFPYWSGQDLGIGDLLEGIGLGFDWTYEAMTPAERAKLVNAITANEQLLFDRTLLHPTNAQSNNPISNWMGVTAGGAGLALLAIRGEPGVPVNFQTYLDSAQSKIGDFLSHTAGQFGENQEGYQYSGYGLKNAVPYALAARRDGLADILTNSNATRMVHWASYEQVPGEGNTFVPLNDSSRVSFGVDIAALFFAMAPDDGVSQWFWQHTVGPKGDDYYARPAALSTAGYDDKCAPAQNSPVNFALCQTIQMHGNVWAILFYRAPTETPEVDPATVLPFGRHYPERGLVDARTGWSNGTQDVVTTFEARRNGTSHFQYDLGNFTLYGGGAHWAIDPGYSCVGCGRTEEAGYATAHNVVVIDGKKDTQYVWSRYFNGTTIDDTVETPNVSLAHADLRYAYNFESPHASRDHFFSSVPGRPIILAIGDSVQRDTGGSHTYTWQLLTHTGNTVVPDGGSGFQVLAPSGATLAGRAAVDGSAAADPRVLTRYQVFDNVSDDAPGAPVAYTTTPAQPKFDQLTVMALTPAGQPAATTEIVRVTGGNAVAVTSAGVTDIVATRLDGATQLTGATLATDGSFAKLTLDAAETVLRAGTYLRANGRDYVVVTGGPATVTVSSASSSITATGPVGATYRVFAPQGITSVTVDGTAVNACRTGDELSFPC